MPDADGAVPERGRGAAPLAIGGVLLVLHLVGCVLVLAGGSGGVAVALGVGSTAYLLGVRHAFDADHIAAIDNVTRRLNGRGRRSSSVGFWFSLGHSTVVVATVALLTAGVASVVHAARDDGPVRLAADAWGTGVSVVFVLAFGLVNLVSLVTLLRGRTPTASGGAMFRVLNRAVALVDRPVRMYPVGLLFALGLDTAGTIALLVTAGAASPGVPWSLTAAVPVLFTAGMALGDTVDGVFAAVGFERFGFTVAGVFVAVALVAAVSTRSDRRQRALPAGAPLPLSTTRRS